MNSKIVYRCNVCYLQKGVLLTSCGCFYCADCFKSSKSYINIQNVTCFGCSKIVDFSKTIDITNKDSVKKVEFIYDDPEVQLKKILEVIKFQKLHKNKYVDFLEKKITDLQLENSRLKETHFKSDNNQTSFKKIQVTDNKERIESIYNNCSVNPQLNGTINNTHHNNMNFLSTYNNSNNSHFVDIKQIKKLEPKKNEKTSVKNLPGNSDYVKTNNLNAKTAEIMKSSPGVAGNLNQRSILNVNINNSSRRDFNDVSEYEKNLFNNNCKVNPVNTYNQNPGINTGLTPNQTTLAKQNSNFFQYTKRKYNQLGNQNENILQTEVDNRNCNNLNYQTPINSSFNFNDYQCKKFKYN